MLKKFFLNLASSFVGTWLALLIFIGAAILTVLGIVGSMAISGSNETASVESRSILKIDLDGAVTEREMPVEPSLSQLVSGGLETPQTLDVITMAIKEAAENDDIIAIYLKCGSLSASPATLNAIRHELQEFRKSGKKVYAYGDTFTQGCYFIASAADKVYMNPMGELSLQGMSSTNLYMKGLLDKLGVQFQVVKVGTYKSAVEPYILEDMSEPARAQMDTLLTNMWDYIAESISVSRIKMTDRRLNALIDSVNISYAPQQVAVKSGLIDKLMYEREMTKKLAEIAGKSEEKLNLVSPQTLVTQSPWSDAYDSKKRIAVLYAVGEIEDGNSNAIDYQTLVPLINKLADDENVKGMVLRVNSPGGSAFGSDQIGNALDYFQSKGKPLAVSMGDYAASGGYWISACADRIFADPLTITGSIGIFGLIPNFKGTMNMLGVNAATVSTNPEANFPTIIEPMTERQLQVMQKYVERGYDAFTSRVAKGRKMSQARVRQIGEGRVWDASKAQQIGLVDSLGYLQNAIDWVANKAKLNKDYDVAAYPEFKPTIWNMIPLGGSSIEEMSNAISRNDWSLFNAYLIKKILARKPVQARMPAIMISI